MMMQIHTKSKKRGASVREEGGTPSTNVLLFPPTEAYFNTIKPTRGKCAAA